MVLSPILIVVVVDGFSTAVKVISSPTSCRISLNFRFPEHAKRDWKAHKKTCQITSKLKTTGWTPIPLPSGGSDPILDKIGAQGYVNVDTLAESACNDPAPLTIPATKPSTPPANPHGTNPFVLKMQLDVGTRTMFLIYDQARSLQTSIFKHTVEPYIWEKMERTIRENGLYGGWKMYVWARRTTIGGDDTAHTDLGLEVALDQDCLPVQQDIHW